MPIPSTGGQGSSSAAVDPLAARPISAIMPQGGARHTSIEGNKNSKNGIISDVRRMQAKRKVVLAMGEAVADVPNVAKKA